MTPSDFSRGLIGQKCAVWPFKTNLDILIYNLDWSYCYPKQNQVFINHEKEVMGIGYPGD